MFCLLRGGLWPAPSLTGGPETQSGRLLSQQEAGELAGQILYLQEGTWAHRSHCRAEDV